MTEYSARYESTQGYSATFNRFHRKLAQDFVHRFDLRNKHIIEVGCGDGEFLVLLCEEGDNSGLGFDPAHKAGRVPKRADTRVEFVTDFYSERYSDRLADVLVCKMTLEHIVNTAEFVRMIRSSVRDPETIVVLQVPNSRRILADVAFWDVYYEHCSYFSAGSLARLVRQQSFDVFDLWTDYDDQYLMLAARPAPAPTRPRLDAEADLDIVRNEVAAFSAAASERVGAWRTMVEGEARAGRNVVLWGGGSKGVAFLTTTGLGDSVAGVVDINPHKANTFMAGSGHQIIAPHELIRLQPDLVLVMNQIYVQEVRDELARLGISARVSGIG